MVKSGRSRKRPIAKAGKDVDEPLKDPWKKLREKPGVRIISTAKVKPE